ncbi:ATP-binding protein [Ktedonobacter sp. SOSP1-85]|uniref:ATP-binding protein n=1 Tax=Ktedonobacter sp. SOSP1-85 TaxID=2778367 RepID=UPI001915726C|nr:ATP-binding protein [Ktedonobacter sp. SOSP1-85]GHO76383.1 ATP-binding protein [Ktedonobacter sp. SOSP1-85]
MKIAFVGKGGSGKTTLSALFCRSLACFPVPILAFDADINQHLGEALGLSEHELAHIPALGLEMERIKEYLRGSNERIPRASVMTKTTPPGRGSRLWRVREDNALLSYFGRDSNGVKLLVTGPFQEQDLGLKCYHSKVGAVELLLNHCVEGPDEYVVVDMTAGADSFASGLFTRFDITFLVVEPTRKSLGVYRQYAEYARGYDVHLQVIANKVETEDDLTFVRKYVEENLLTWFGRSSYVRAMEKGEILPLTALEEDAQVALAVMKRAVDGCSQDWEKFYRQAVEFHRRNALAWMNTSLGEDVTTQIAPSFSLSAMLTSVSL